MKPICLLACLVSATLHAATVTGEFRLAEGHAGRRELAFAVRAPGSIQVRIESDAPGIEYYAMLVHHLGPVHNTQGTGVVQLGSTATARQVSQAHEWAVRVQAVTPGQQATGRIIVNYPDAAVTASHELDAWLQRNPAVAMHLRWPAPGGTRAYSAWPQDMKEHLWQYFDLTRQGQPPSLPDPPRNVWNYSGGDDPKVLHTALSIEDATNLYLASIAHSLVIEIDRKVPWTLQDLNEDELEAIFSGTGIYHWNERQQAYEIAEFNYGWSVPPPPQVAWEFLCNRHLLRATRLETITALLGWCQGLTHIMGAITPGNFEHHWGYRGNAPVSRVIAGTRYTGSEFPQVANVGEAKHYTAGCHGTVGLLISVLHAANVPTKYRGVGGNFGTHATILFLSEDKALTHGDDPYSQTAARARPEELLIDLATYNEWLGPLAPNPGPNVGRQPLVLGVRHLAPFLLRAYQKDKTAGVARAQGEVADTFKGVYTVQELETARLWERMDAELADGNPTAISMAKTSPVAMKQDIGLEKQGPPPATANLILIEAESLKPDASAGQTQEQDMSAFTAASWSGGRQLWWTGGKTGDSLTLAFSVNSPGVYRIAASFTRASDYGMVSVSVNGSPTKAGKLDLYDPQVSRTAPVPLGEFKLDAGHHRMGITIAGCNEAATPSFMVGLDQLQFERID